MLNLRSFRDYPDVFRDGTEAGFLTERERKLLASAEVRSRRQAWVLGRLTAKELVQRYCDETAGIIPGARQISVVRDANGVPIVELEGGAGGAIQGPIGVSLAYCDNYAFAAVRNTSGGHAFAVTMDRVEPQYPFFEDDKLTEDEVARVRLEDVTTQDRLLTTFWSLKKAVHKALGEASGDWANLLEVIAVKAGGEAEIRYDPALFGGDATPTVRVRAWFYDTYVLAFAGIWRGPLPAPAPTARIEEEPVLPDARYNEWTR